MDSAVKESVSTSSTNQVSPGVSTTLGELSATLWGAGQRLQTGEVSTIFMMSHMMNTKT